MQQAAAAVPPAADTLPMRWHMSSAKPMPAISAHLHLAQGMLAVALAPRNKYPRLSAPVRGFFWPTGPGLHGLLLLQSTLWDLYAYSYL